MSVAAHIESWALLVGRAVRGVPSTRLRPAAFFVARSGVLTLAFEGFPQSLQRVKRSLRELSRDLPRENPGSRWPKITLAAVMGEVLAAEEIERLQSITEETDRAHLVRAPGIPVRDLEIVELLDRSAESVGRKIRIPLEPPPDDGAIDEAHRAEVRAVLDQWRLRASGYHDEVSRPANREKHYRSRHHELSLLCRPGAELPGVDHLQAAVEDALPGRYAWFAPESRHVTLRTLGKLPV